MVPGPATESPASRLGSYTSQTPATATSLSPRNRRNKERPSPPLPIKATEIRCEGFWANAIPPPLIRNTRRFVISSDLNGAGDLGPAISPTGTTRESSTNEDARTGGDRPERHLMVERESCSGQSSFL